MYMNMNDFFNVVNNWTNNILYVLLEVHLQFWKQFCVTSKTIVFTKQKNYNFSNCIKIYNPASVNIP